MAHRGCDVWDVPSLLSRSSPVVSTSSASVYQQGSFSQEGHPLMLTEHVTRSVKGGTAMALYVSLSFAYRISSVLLSLVARETYWLKPVKVLCSEAWLKSRAITIT